MAVELSIPELATRAAAVAGGAARWLLALVQRPWQPPPLPAWTLAAAALSYYLAYRLGRQRGRRLLGRILDPKPWTARGVVWDERLSLDGEHQRVLDALGSEKAAAASSVATLTNLTWESVREVARELEGVGYVQVHRFKVGDWLLEMTPEGQQALRRVVRAGRVVQPRVGVADAGTAEPRRPSPAPAAPRRPAPPGVHPGASPGGRGPADR